MNLRTMDVDILQGCMGGGCGCAHSWLGEDCVSDGHGRMLASCICANVVTWAGFKERRVGGEWHDFYDYTCGKNEYPQLKHFDWCWAFQPRSA